MFREEIVMGLFKSNKKQTEKDSIILIITKVEDPEELDTRFSKFSPYKSSRQDSIQFDGADNIIDIFQKLSEARQTEHR